MHKCNQELDVVPVPTGAGAGTSPDGGAVQGGGAGSTEDALSRMMAAVPLSELERQLQVRVTQESWATDTISDSEHQEDGSLTKESGSMRPAMHPA
jgi:hypothetical protein